LDYILGDFFSQTHPVTLLSFKVFFFGSEEIEENLCAKVFRQDISLKFAALAIGKYKTFNRKMFFFCCRRFANLVSKHSQSAYIG
jgi:hypothetical protein